MCTLHVIAFQNQFGGFFAQKEKNFLWKYGEKHTVWKFQDFSISQILREINFGDSISAKTPDFALLGLTILSIWKISVF